MAAQRVRITWEFDIDDTENVVSTMHSLTEVTKSIYDHLAVTDDIRVARFEVVLPKHKVSPPSRQTFQRRYVIEVVEGGRWVPWDRVGGGERVEFDTIAEARACGLATRELHAENEGKSWRIAEVRR